MHNATHTDLPSILNKSEIEAILNNRKHFIMMDDHTLVLIKEQTYTLIRAALLSPNQMSTPKGHCSRFSFIFKLLWFIHLHILSQKKKRSQRLLDKNQTCPTFNMYNDQSKKNKTLNYNRRTWTSICMAFGRRKRKQK